MSVPRNIVGIAWYRPQDWMRLREISVDRDNLEESHAEWRDKTNRTLHILEKRGHKFRRVIVELDELIAWAAAGGKSIDAEACSSFVAHKLLLEEQDQGGEKGAHPGESPAL